MVAAIATPLWRDAGAGHRRGHARPPLRRHGKALDHDVAEVARVDQIIEAQPIGRPIAALVLGLV